MHIKEKLDSLKYAERRNNQFRTTLHTYLGPQSMITRKTVKLNNETRNVKNYNIFLCAQGISGKNHRLNSQNICSITLNISSFKN